MSFSLFGGGKPENDPEPVVTAPKGISSVCYHSVALSYLIDGSKQAIIDARPIFEF
jgi:hypothetical protein